jgi:hypothetical protein
MAKSILYEMARLAELKGFKADYDFLLVAGSSDERAYETLRQAGTCGISFRRALLFDFEERKDFADNRAKEAYESYSKHHPKTTPLLCSLKEPWTGIKAIGGKGFKFGKQSRIAVDISSFNRPFFFALLKYLQDHCGVTSVDVYYTEPQSYVLPKGLIRSYRASVGPLFVTEVPGFPGLPAVRPKTLLIVTLGFDGDLSAFISEEVTPDSVVIVNGFPAYSPKFKDISLINNERLLNYSDARDRIAYCRATNPYEVFNLLTKLRTDFPSFFFNIAPLGPKPMALGVCMFALSDSSVRVIYPMPEKYASKTTHDCWQTWRYVVPLGKSLTA